MSNLHITLATAAIAAVCMAQEPAGAPAAASAAVQSAPSAKADAAQQKTGTRRLTRRPRRPDMPHRMGMAYSTVRPFGKLSTGETAMLYRIQGRGGLILDVTDYGGRLVRCYVPDKYGNLADVTLGWNTPEEYEKFGFSMGTIIGRYANRIADGKFTIDGKECQLAINEDKKTETTQRHCNLHGGPIGWDKKIWSVRPLRLGPVQGLELTYVSADGEMGFPGTVKCKVTYKVKPDNSWTISYEATTDKPTVINPTHHSYWNLAGEGSGNVLEQELQIFADSYMKTTPGLIPTETVPVKGTGFDFTDMRRIGAKADMMQADKSLAATDSWYDHNFVLRGEAGKLRKAAAMRDPVSGRTLEIWTTEPCMQMYGAQNMTDELPAKAVGRHLCKYAGVALETQHAPNSPNRPDFPSTVLRPGETFKSTTEYRFGVDHR